MACRRQVRGTCRRPARGRRATPSAAPPLLAGMPLLDGSLQRSIKVQESQPALQPQHWGFARAASWSVPVRWSSGATVAAPGRLPHLSRNRMGPLSGAPGSSTCPFCVISSTPLAARARPACRVSSISSRQRCGKAARGASLGQHVAPGLRLRRMASIACSRACCSAPACSSCGAVGCEGGRWCSSGRGVPQPAGGEVAVPCGTAGPPSS